MFKHIYHSLIVLYCCLYLTIYSSYINTLNYIEYNIAKYNQLSILVYNKQI